MFPRTSLLVCRNPRCDGGGHAAPIESLAREQVSAQRLPLEVFGVGCLDLCGAGPHVVVHGAPGRVDARHHAPDGGVAYDRVDAGVLLRILEEHVLGGRPVADHLHDPSIRR